MNLVEPEGPRSLYVASPSTGGRRHSGTEPIQGSYDTRCVAAVRRECGGEARLGTPARAVPGREQPRHDARLEISKRLFNAGLDALAGEMKSAHDGIDW